MWRAPSFWRDDDGPTLASRLLSPLGSVYAGAVARKIRQADPVRVPVPVICVGNITMGGVGKTPFVRMLASQLLTMGHKPFILMRGFGGKEKGPVRVMPHHTARDVGDEARMLAATVPVIVAQDRPAGAGMAVTEGASVVVMDDGFQNPSLAKDLCFVLIDAETGFGNGYVFPAGPLRERPEDAFARADAVVLVGNGDPPAEAPTTLPVFRADLSSLVPADLEGAKAHAFSGIGRPQKFFQQLEEFGIKLLNSITFPDHHAFSGEEIAKLKDAAQKDSAMLLTTEKDRARLDDEQAKGITVISAAMSIDLPRRFADLVKDTVGEPK